MIEVLIKISDLNEKLKLDIYEQVMCSISQIILHGNEVEKEYGLKLVWKLCFSRELLLEIKNDLNLNSFIRGLASNGTLWNKNVVKYCELIIYCINKREELPRSRMCTIVKDSHYF